MRPYVIIFSTETIDGRLASKTGFSELSCPWDKLRQNQLRAQVDAVVVGGNTVRVDNPSLILKGVKGKQPIRVVISSSLRLDPSYRIFTVPPTTVVYAGYSHDREVRRKLEAKGVVVREFAGEICEALEDLNSSFSINSVMIEGGGNLLWSVVKSGCYDELRVTISPRLFGSGRSLVDGEGFEGPESPTLKLISYTLCECKNEIHLIYKKS